MLIINELDNLSQGQTYVANLCAWMAFYDQRVLI